MSIAHIVLCYFSKGKYITCPTWFAHSIWVFVLIWWPRFFLKALVLGRESESAG